MSWPQKVSTSFPSFVTLELLKTNTRHRSLIFSTIFVITENTMDQDDYGGYSKQQIGSLTTDGEGELRKHFCVSGNIPKKKRLTFNEHALHLLSGDGHEKTLFPPRLKLINQSRKCKVASRQRGKEKKSLGADWLYLPFTLSCSPTEGFYVKKYSCRMNPLLV